MYLTVYQTLSSLDIELLSLGIQPLIAPYGKWSMLASRLYMPQGQLECISAMFSSYYFSPNYKYPLFYGF